MSDNVGLTASTYSRFPPVSNRCIYMYTMSCPNWACEGKKDTCKLYLSQLNKRKEKNMSRPPLKAMQSIKNYCEKTQCRRCVFGIRVNPDDFYIGCKLQEDNPCDWDISEEDEEKK